MTSVIACTVALALFTGDMVKAAIDGAKMPDVLYEGSILTFKAKSKTFLNSEKNPFSVTLITADSQELNLEVFVKPGDTLAQVVLPLLPEKAGNLFRVILKTSGGDVSSTDSEGFSRLLARKTSTSSTNLSSDKPISPSVDLSAALILPNGTDPGLSLTGAQGAQGVAGAPGGSGPQGPVGATGAQGPIGLTGATGAQGLSAYQVALAGGFVGTEAQWLQSLKGADGAAGATGAQGIQGAQGPAGPVGDRGPVGPQGPQGLAGVSGGTITGTVNSCPSLDGASFSIHLANASGVANLSASSRSFQFSNVPAGTYSLIVKQFNTVAGSVSNVSVTNGASTNAGDIAVSDCD